MRTRWLVVGAVLGAVVVACSTAPEEHLVPPDVKDLSGARAAPPPDDELAHGGVAIDVTVPDMFRSGDPSSAERNMGHANLASRPPVVVFLNRAGGTYTQGADNAPGHVSSVLSYYGKASVTLPPAGYAGAAWQELVDCVSAHFDGINVAITDARPAGGAYSELVVSNTWAGTALGISNGIGGIAPLGACRVVPQAVGYVFEAIYDTPGYGGVRGACEATAHEIGHTLSLSHERLATDLMSYAPVNPNKAFQASASACGVSAQAPEACSCGGSTQSSRQQLLSIVGPAGSDPGTGNGDTTPPLVSVIAPASGAVLPGNAVVQVVVDASDETALAEVKLVWQYTGAVLACDGSVQGVTCTRVGPRSTWSILVGSGARGFYAYARDAAGNTTSTTVVTIDATSTTIPPVEAPPVVIVQFPGENQAVSAGSELIFQAHVQGSRPIADVRAVWSYPGGTLDYPMTLTAAPGVYQARTTVSASAQPGWRSVEIQASDDRGRRTFAPRRNVSVQ